MGRPAVDARERYMALHLDSHYFLETVPMRDEVMVFPLVAQSAHLWAASMDGTRLADDLDFDTEQEWVDPPDRK